MVKKAIGGAVVALFSLLLVEGILALLGLPRSIYTGDPAKVWWVDSDLTERVQHIEEQSSFELRTDSHGFRGDGPPEGKEWWLALGCSTTFGWGVSEEETWVMLLSKQLGIPIVNGGVPGWSTEQAREGLKRWAHLSPALVLISYGVRDAQLASLEDRASQGTPWLLQRRLLRLMMGVLKPKASVASQGTVARVSPDRYGENLSAIELLWPQAKVVYFSFPQQDKHVLYEAEMEARAAIKLEQPAPDLFFSSDPIHLQPEGHRWLAEQLATSLQRK